MNLLAGFPLLLLMTAALLGQDKVAALTPLTDAQRLEVARAQTKAIAAERNAKAIRLEITMLAASVSQLDREARAAADGYEKLLEKFRKECGAQKDCILSQDKQDWICPKSPSGVELPASAPSVGEGNTAKDGK